MTSHSHVFLSSFPASKRYVSLDAGMPLSPYGMYRVLSRNIAARSCSGTTTALLFITKSSQSFKSTRHSKHSWPDLGIPSCDEGHFVMTRFLTSCMVQSWQVSILISSRRASPTPIFCFWSIPVKVWQKSDSSSVSSWYARDRVSAR